MSVHVALACHSLEVRDALMAQAGADTQLRLSARVGLQPAVMADLLIKEAADVVILELGNDPAASLAQLAEIAPRAAGVPVVVISADETAEFLRQAMRAGARDVLAPPLDLALVRRIAAEHAQVGRAGVDRHGDVHAFYPVKGGSGCTFLATNLAHALAQQGDRVLLVDLNLFFGEAAGYLTDQVPKASVLDLARQVQRLDAALLSTSVMDVGGGLHVLPAPELPYDLGEVTPSVLDNLLTLARMAYDHVVLDLGADLTPLNVHALELSDRISLTMVPMVPALQNLKHVLAVLRELRIPEQKLAVVLNAFDKTASLRVEEIERVAGLAVARTIAANVQGVQAAINQGVPLARLLPKDPVVRAMADWAAELAPARSGSGAEAGRSGWLSKLTGRRA